MFGAPSAALRRRGGRWRLRDWRLRTKLTAVLLVPLLLAGVLGALRVTDLLRKADASAALARQVGFAQRLGVVIHELQGERYRVAEVQASGRIADRADVQMQAQRVDTAVTRLGDAQVQDFPAAAQTQWAPAYRAARNRLSGLAAFRRTALPPNAAPGEVSARTAATAYTNLIGVLLDVQRQALAGAPEELDPQADAVKALAIAQEQASREQAALQIGIFADGLPPDQQAALRAADARFDAAADEFGEATSPTQRQLYFGARTVLDRKRLLNAALERAMRAAPLDTVPGDWNSAAAGTVETIWQGQTALLGQLRTGTGARGDRALREAYWDAAVVVLLLMLAVALLVVVVRSLLQPLRALRTAAFEVADRRLPEAIEQLRAADGTPGGATVDPVPVHSREEVGQVARAFDTVHVQAVRLAAEQAQLRSSLNDVFVSLSGRNQQLLQCQRQLIDEARSQAAGPELASRLSQLDRLVCRMRRHSDNLLAVAGGTQRRSADGNGVDSPASVLDVMTGAVAEIEHGARVTVCSPSAATIAGPVVTDLVHLIAELLDNAITATPDGASVTLGGVLTEDKGLLLEVTDSGPGLSREALQTINARLASAPTADPPVAGQAGLVIARELAEQHGITVRLRQRLGGKGLTATVLLPPSMVMVDLRVSSTHPPTDGAERTADDGAPPAEWSGTQQQQPPPMRVSVIDEAAAADLFSPASITPVALAAVTPPLDQPRTAQEEWLELFGSSEPGSEREPISEGAQPGALAADSPARPAALDGISVPAGAPEVREEIFEMVSAWFRERQVTGADSEPTMPDWQSPFDEGWQAAQALRGHGDHELTEAGLPKRQPRAQLVSGADDVFAATPQSAALARTAEDIRGRLSRYQRGLRVGRHARTDAADQLSCTDTLPRPLAFAYEPFEEYQQ